MEIRQLTQDIVQWADSVFPDRKPESALLKLFEETGELVRDPTAAGEYADICIMVFDLAHMHGIDLAQAIREKIEVNKNRVWRKTLTGTLQHDEKGPDSFRQLYELGKHHANVGQPKVGQEGFDNREQWLMYNKGYDLGIGDSE